MRKEETFQDLFLVFHIQKGWQSTFDRKKRKIFREYHIKNKIFRKKNKI